MAWNRSSSSSSSPSRAMGLSSWSQPTIGKKRPVLPVFGRQQSAETTYPDINPDPIAGVEPVIPPSGMPRVMFDEDEGKGGVSRISADKINNELEREVIRLWRNKEQDALEQLAGVLQCSTMEIKAFVDSVMIDDTPSTTTVKWQALPCLQLPEVNTTLTKFWLDSEIQMYTDDHNQVGPITRAAFNAIWRFFMFLDHTRLVDMPAILMHLLSELFVLMA